MVRYVWHLCYLKITARWTISASLESEKKRGLQTFRRRFSSELVQHYSERFPWRRQHEPQ